MENILQVIEARTSACAAYSCLTNDKPDVTFKPVEAWALVETRVQKGAQRQDERNVRGLLLDHSSLILAGSLEGFLGYYYSFQRDKCKDDLVVMAQADLEERGLFKPEPEPEPEETVVVTDDDEDEAPDDEEPDGPAPPQPSQPIPM